jgi:hypothetical protein
MIGYIDVHIQPGDFVVRGLAVFLNGDRLWINLPNRSYKDPDTRETKWSPIVAIDEKENFLSFMKNARDAFREYCIHKKLDHKIPPEPTSIFEDAQQEPMQECPC